MRVRHLVAVWVQEKEEPTIDGAEPGQPGSEELAARLTDVLADVTKHDAGLGWRVVSVEPG